MSSSSSARTELRLVLARNLGLSAQSLLGERVEFVWHGETRFKHFSSDDQHEQNVITSFATSAAKAILQALPERLQFDIPSLDASKLRNTLLGNSEYVDLRALVTFCWSVGIPVIGLRVTPLAQKRMHAMVASYAGRYVVMLARETNHQTVAAFTLAHELGHIFLGHLNDDLMIVDAKSSMEVGSDDVEEQQADEFAHSLLLGKAAAEITFDNTAYNAPGLAHAAAQATKGTQVHPAAVVLSFAHQQSDWARGMSALKFIEKPNKEFPVWRAINQIAAHELDMSLPNQDTAEFLSKLLDLEHV